MASRTIDITVNVSNMLEATRELRAFVEAAYAEGYRLGYLNGAHDVQYNEPIQYRDETDYGDGFDEWLQERQEAPRGEENHRPVDKGGRSG